MDCLIRSTKSVISARNVLSVNMARKIRGSGRLVKPARARAHCRALPALVSCALGAPHHGLLGIARGFGANFKSFQDHGFIHRPCQLAGFGIDTHETDCRRNAKWRRHGALKRRFHESPEDRSGNAPACFIRTQ